ncbi:MAG: pyrimidine dimer DNA glycosylase/endonuclease V [Flavobacteriaceae bacterium]
MRIWSLHPSLLDTKGLVALWREALLAKHVLEGKTKGYTNHPQLNRFKATENPVFTINYYLSEVQKEAEQRGYNFDKNKIDWSFEPITITVNDKQTEYEFRHLLKKLEIRDVQKFESIKNQKKLLLHPMFIEIKGEIENWEIIT